MTAHPGHLRSHTFHGLAPGTRLLVTGAVHGNETCGTQAINHILAEIDSGQLTIARGTVTFVPVTNPLAYQRRQRMGELNLNRNLRISAIPQDFEDRVAGVLCPLLESHQVLLDLHSFRGGGTPFVMMGPANNTGALQPFSHEEAERQLALHTGPHRIVTGWLDAYARGTARRASAPSQVSSTADGPITNPNYGVGTTEYLRARGGYGVTLECGEHDDPQAVGVARHAIRQTLALLGICDIELNAEPQTRETLRLVDVVDKQDRGDVLAREWRNFDPVQAGELIGTRAGGEGVTAPTAGFVVFAHSAAKPGTEWFYFAELA